MPYPALHLSLGHRVEKNWDELPPDLHEHILRFKTVPRVEQTVRSGFIIYSVKMGDFSLTFDAHPIRTFLEDKYMAELSKQKDDLSSFNSAAITQELIRQIVFIATLSFELPKTSQLYQTLQQLPDSRLEQAGTFYGRVFLNLAAGRQPRRTTKALDILFQSMIVRELWHALEAGLRSKTTRLKIERHDDKTEWKQLPLYEQLVLPLLSSIGPK